ncbi:DUF2637 domain-containing protein [Streptomyces sp. NPDC008079]|uniref:DUF2637 domain-containing protein n=1 Tax=Streptomyces sp. NPDC008079 TaxID=3364806 RepID=UPI0036E949BD
MTTAHATATRRFTSAFTEEKITDAAIYLLALGGFYITYQTLYQVALTNGFPPDQAVVVGALADLAILAYSRKAVQEVQQGRSAWGIRLIVAALSMATVALQLRAAWPHPTALGQHALPAVVWITGLEMMLRGKLRAAKAARRQALIDAGLRPAPLAKLRLSEWILSPWPTFLVWRIMNLRSATADTAKAHLARTWTKTAPMPASWTVTVPAVLATVPPFKTLERPRFALPAATAAAAPAPVAPLPTIKHTDGTEATPQEVTAFLGALPAAPGKGRSKAEARVYQDAVQQIADEHTIMCTGTLIARLLDVSPGYVSQLKHVTI